jgi:hypothetical protein
MVIFFQQPITVKVLSSGPPSALRQRQNTYRMHPLTRLEGELKSGAILVDLLFSTGLDRIATQWNHHLFT